jgi:hypothetical protein
VPGWAVSGIGDHAAGRTCSGVALGRGHDTSRVGRPRLLGLDFAALTRHGPLFASLSGARAWIGLEAPDDVSDGVFGLMLPLIAADLTRKAGDFSPASVGSTLRSASIRRSAR